MGSERRGKGSDGRVGQQQRCQQQSPCSPTIPCTSVSAIYRSTVSSIHTAPVCSPQRILFIVSRTQLPRCDSGSLDMCCFLSVCSQSLVLYSSVHLHRVSLVIVLYAALWLSLAAPRTDCLLPSLLSLPLSLTLSLSDHCHYNLTHSPKKGTTYKSESLLSSCFDVRRDALLVHQHTQRDTHEALKSGSLRCVF
ncbi:hypothetical protein QQF64_030497 [Cirrhinus molitorella]|uniref:Uncharacterized protein n=1 Tax=Cirrhinus molitorella TaxID=172907 RepID=A0ABR3N3P3_9TELE